MNLIEWTPEELAFMERVEKELEQKKFYLVYTKISPAIDSWRKLIQALIDLGESPFEPEQRVIPRYYLSNVKGISKLEIPEGVLEIDSFAFNDSTINEFVIPHSIKIMQTGAFRSTYIHQVTYKGTKAEWVKVVKTHCFGGCETPSGQFRIICTDGFFTYDEQGFYL